MSTPTSRRVTLADVEQQARADLARGGTAVAVDWVFRHARAVARLAEAEQAWKSFDADRYRLTIDLSGTKYDPATLNLLPGPERDQLEAMIHVTASLHAAASDLGEARSVETACAHVLRLIEKQAARPQQVPAAPKADAAKKAA